MPESTTCCVVFASGEPCTTQRLGRSPWCKTCYGWSRSHGGANPTGRPRRIVQGHISRAAELAAAARSTSDECIFLTTKSANPVVAVRLRRKHISAARAVWIMAHGDPGDLLVLHGCNGGSGSHGCVNIQHLRLGDNAQNMRDRAAAGRFKIPPENRARGEAQGASKLTEAQVREIRQKCADGAKQRDVARQYGVVNSTVCQIVNRKMWGWLE